MVAPLQRFSPIKPSKAAAAVVSRDNHGIVLVWTLGISVKTLLDFLLRVDDGSTTYIIYLLGAIIFEDSVVNTSINDGGVCDVTLLLEGIVEILIQPYLHFLYCFSHRICSQFCPLCLIYFFEVVCLAKVVTEPTKL
jgi:hypothetical protein